MRKFLKNQKGVTMMEVLVTVALLAIVVVPCLSSFIMAQSGNVKAAEVTNAYTAAANLMETLKAIPEPTDAETTWKDEVKEAIDEAQKNKDDNISVYSLYHETGNYYDIKIYLGELEQEPNGENAAEPFVKGVIAP